LLPAGCSCDYEPENPNGDNAEQTGNVSDKILSGALPNGDTYDAISKIAIGTKDTELIAVLKPKSLDFGTVYLGGDGRRRMYFQIEPGKQIRFDLSGPAGGDRVTRIGKISPKTKWTHYDGDSILIGRK
jgi:hypothetical protein